MIDQAILTKTKMKTRLAKNIIWVFKTVHAKETG
jgi:hypothetical protein